MVESTDSHAKPHSADFLRRDEKIRGEQWRPLPSNADYSVSNLRRVRSNQRIAKRSDGRRVTLPTRILIPQKTPNAGRYVFELRTNGRPDQRRLDHLFAETWPELTNLLEPGEEWREIPGYPRYAASSFGRIKRLGNARIPDRILKQTLLPQNVLRVSVRINKKPRIRTVSCLVALAFLDGHREGWPLKHIDGDKLNNAAANLKSSRRKRRCRDPFPVLKRDTWLEMVSG
jgi:hypothetical protein